MIEMTLQEYFTSYYNTISKGNIEELDQYYHSAAPLMNAAKSQWESMRKQLDFTMTLTHVELLAKQDDLLVVRDEMKFEGEVNGESVAKHSTNVHSLTKENDEWKLFSTSNFPEAMV